jgi:hypothetical protein
MTYSRAEKLRFIVYLAIFLVVMITGTVGFMEVENLPLTDAVYFTIVTIATVGYGDISPVTGVGKALAIILIVTGVGTFVGMLANATEMFLNRRDNTIRRQKLQMVIGLFFSEAGTRLMRYFAEADKDYDFMAGILVVKNDWGNREFQQARKKLDGHSFEVDMQRVDLHALKALLDLQKDLLVRLLESPYMLEHESFTDQLVAVLHLKEELAYREEYFGLPITDREHLGGDIQRAYSHLVRQWLDYVAHLQDRYPFLFSLALRTNPFDRQASAIVRQTSPSSGGSECCLDKVPSESQGFPL